MIMLPVSLKTVVTVDAICAGYGGRIAKYLSDM